MDKHKDGYEPENRFLYKQHIAAGFLDLLADVQDVLSLFLKYAIHLAVVRHYHLVLHLYQEKRKEAAVSY